MLIKGAIVGVLATIDLVNGFRLTGLRQSLTAPISRSSMNAATREAIIQPSMISTIEVLITYRILISTFKLPLHGIQFLEMMRSLV
jgi:hypothetical protein